VRVTRVRIENIKGFRDGPSAVDLDFTAAGGELPRWIVVAGRNGAGKTTFLQALALALVGPRNALTLRGSFADWIRAGARSGEVLAWLRVAEGRKREPNVDVHLGLGWTRHGADPEPALLDSWQHPRQSEPGREWDPFSRGGPWSAYSKRYFVTGYGPFRRLSRATLEAERLMAMAGRPAGLASLFHEDASLAEAVSWLRWIYLRRLEDVPGAAQMHDAVLALLNDGLLPEGMRVVKVTSDGLWVRTPAGPKLPLQALSDGYRTVAALVLDLLRQLELAYGHLDTIPNHPHVAFPHQGVVLIDEIDAHLHVSWQQTIGFWFKDHFPGLQFIVSTHSPFICQAADPGGLVRLPAPGEDGPARILEGEVYNRVVNGSVDDAVLTDLFGLETTYSKRSRDIRDEVARLESRAATGQLTADEQDRLVTLQRELPTTLSSEVASALRQLAHKIDDAED
jgi:Predicted ATP-binding protein involved in virulence